ncbi:hypothetical protein DVH26_17850 [Paenibacillus sp. H1-7]|uniref:phosphotransferase enzyme family protein n=1 Tax=Paenibacillus sp. H1-7 TaxID=2282849 RepID=UPI001EF90C46|nr:phosphotransferase [Paenibacillus sp. H1-7]ULL16153.1 hypothetical protein DVH26_17850 [Paenibacillus sp. H1-7]
MGQDLIKEILAMLEVDPSDCKLTGGYSSNVFEVGRSEKFIVKILEKSVVNESSILAEMEWLDFLFSRGIHAARPIRKLGKDYIQQINDDYYFVSYEKINGLHVRPADKENWGARLFEQWGEAMGQIHAASKAYKANNAFPTWNENKTLLALESLQLHPLLVEKWSKYMNEQKQLPASSDHFELIHGDLHHGNLLLSENALCVIDFGDSEYHWFMKGYVRWNPDTSFTRDINYFIHIDIYTHSLITLSI